MALGHVRNISIGIEYNLDKIRNIILFLSNSIDYLYITKLIKLLYLIDETSIKQSSVPITWLDFKVWQRGPVPDDIYYDLRNNKTEFFADSINSVDDGLGTRIIALKQADLSDFSEYEKNILNQILKDFGWMTGEQLVDHLHTSGSLWDKIANERNLRTHFETSTTSNYSIDFKKLLDEPIKQMAYLAAEDAIYF